MYDFQMPSNFVKRGDPLPPMPPGLENLNGSSRPNASMQPQQPQQAGGMEALMANYSQPAMRPNAPSASLYGGMTPPQAPAFGMPQAFAQNGKNGAQSGMGSQSRSPGPSFFTL